MEKIQPGSNVGLSLVVDSILFYYMLFTRPSTSKSEQTAHYHFACSSIENLKMLDLLVEADGYNEFKILREWLLLCYKTGREVGGSLENQAFDILSSICNREIPVIDPSTVIGHGWRTIEGWGNA